MTEVIIFAGSDARAHAKQWQEQDGRLAGDNVPPVWLGDSQLDELADLKIIDDGRYCVRLYKAGHIKPSNINAIGQKLAAAGVRMRIITLRECTARSGRSGGNIWNGSARKDGPRDTGGRKNDQRKTTLPMSIGSAGYDTQLDYVVKGVIPANSLCSTYGASGSYKSFLACSGRVMLPLAVTGEAAGWHMVR